MIVLLVDPDRHSRRSVRRFLENRGVTVAEADDLEDARSVSAVCYPGAIVSEVFGRPEETVSRLDAMAPGVPVLVWTDSKARGVEGSVRRAGCGFLGKPALASEVAFALGRLSPPAHPPLPGSIRPAVGELRRRNRQRPTAG